MIKPLFKVDRSAVQKILDNYLERDVFYQPKYVRDQKYSVRDRDGLEQALITYCAMIRRGEAPEK